MPQGGGNRYPPSYLEPNYKHEVPSSLGQQVASDKQFSFPEDSASSVFQSTPLPTTPVVSYLDPYTQQNYRYTPTPPPIIQYQREQQPQDDQAYTVQSSLLVGSHQNHQRPGHVEDVYLKRPGYVFDESPSTIYRRPTRPPPSLPPPPTTASHKISYDSHDYPPPSYAAQQTSNFVPQQPKQRPLYQRQDISGNRGGPAPVSPGSPAVPTAPASSNYANSFDNYSQRPNPQQIQIQSPHQVSTEKIKYFVLNLSDYDTPLKKTYKWIIFCFVYSSGNINTTPRMELDLEEEAEAEAQYMEVEQLNPSDPGRDTITTSIKLARYRHRNPSTSSISSSNNNSISTIVLALSHQEAVVVEEQVVWVVV